MPTLPDQNAAELSGEIASLMKRWGEEHGNSVDARVPFAALSVVVARCLRQFPADRRQSIAADFYKSVLKQITS